MTMIYLTTDFTDYTDLDDADNCVVEMNLCNL